MATIFSSFLQDIEQWDVDQLYGRDSSDSSLIHQSLALTTSGDGALVAPFSGTLSVKDPLGGFLDPEFPFPHIPSLPLPDVTPLFLQINWSTYVQDTSIQDRTRELGVMQAFVFLNVETATLKDALGAALDGRTLKGGKFGKSRDVPPPDLKDRTVTRDQAFGMLVTGNLAISVQAGQALGVAAVDPGDASSRIINVASVTNDGLVDPLVTYEKLGDLVDPQVLEALHRFAAPGASGWPVVDPQTDPADFLQEATRVVFPNAALEAARRDLNLSLGTWRQLRDSQKALYRPRLLALVGQGPAQSTAKPFLFDTLDWRNPFQLEAVVEFYANYANPWADGAVPIDPSDVNSFQTVDFQNFEGFSVTASGNTLKFPSDTAPMFKQLTTQGKPGASITEKDNIIELDDDSNSQRPGKRYRVTGIDAPSLTMTIDIAPSIPTAGSAWTLFRRPVLVVVDCFGGRLSGSSAQVVSPDVIQLERAVTKVNPLFDTIYFSSDTGSPSRAYRIVEKVDHPSPGAAAAQYRVVARGATGPTNVHPNFGGGTSTWRIPAGVSSLIEPLGEDLGTSAAGRGWDHFDGMLFVLKDGRVVHEARWSSFTSRNNTDDMRRFQASVGGNMLYRFASRRGTPTKTHLNFCFKVTDPGSDDQVAKAYYYYDPLRRQIPIAPDEHAKAGIRIHYSASVTDNKGIWSAGCLTSVNFAHRMRGILVTLYQQELTGLDQARDPALDRVVSYGQLASMAHFTDADLGDDAWNNKIKGWCWVIRPDELPNGWNLE